MDTLLEFDEKLGVVMSENERRKKHRKLGLCETCSSRLYIVKSNKRIPWLKKRWPVTNQNVLNGRCLDCHPLLPSENKEEHIPNLIQFRHSTKAEYLLHHDTPKHHKRHTTNIVPRMENLDRSNNVTKKLGEHIDKYTKKIQEPIPSPRKKEERNLHLIRLRHSMQEDHPHHDTPKTHKSHDTINIISPKETIDTKIKKKNEEGPYEYTEKYQKPREFSDELGISQSISSADDQQKTRNSKNAQNHLTSCRPETPDLSNVENADLEQIITEMLCDSLTLNRKESLCKDLLALTKNDYSKVEIIMSGGIMIIHNIMVGEHSSNEQLQKNTLALFDVLLPIADDRILNDIPIVETITQLMVLHQTCLEIQQWSINCLRDLADRNERYKMSIAYSGAVDILNSVVSRFSSSPLIKREGHTLIANLVP